MRFLKLILVMVAAVFVATTFAKDETPKGRDKRQQVAFYPRRGGRPPPYAVQMEPIVQYSQRDPLYNPLASSKSDDLYEEAPLNYYPTEPEPIIEIIIKESNESLPTPVPPPPPPTSRPTKEPVQVFYVKYEKKKGYGDKPRVVYDPPVPALTPVEKHEEIKPDNQAPYPEVSVHTPTPAPPEPSTTLRAIIRPESEVYHSGSSGIRITFGTEQVPPNNHNKRSDPETTSNQQQAKPSSPPPGSPKRQHGPYQPIQPVHQRVQPVFPQQRVVNSFPQHQPQPPLNFLQQQPPFSSPPLTRNPLPHRPQRLPITVQGLPEVQQRTPFNNFGPSHRVNVNHPQQPGFPPTLSVSHQNVQIQNQPIPLNQGDHFNVEPQEPQPPSTFKQQELEKQRYHEQRRQQELLKHREHQRQHEQQRLQEHQRFLEQQRQIDQQRQVEQRLLEQQRQQEQQRLQDRRTQEQQRLLEHQRLQEQQRLNEQRRRKQEQEQKLLQEQQYRSQLKYNQPQSIASGPQIPQISQVSKPNGDIFKAVPKLEQHYAIRENPLHPGPFPPNPTVIQPTGFSDATQNQYVSAQPPSTSSDILRNPPSEFVNDQQQHQHTKQQILQNQQQGFFSQNLQQQPQIHQQQQQQQHHQQQQQQHHQQPQRQQQQQQQQQQQRYSVSSQRSSIWGRPSLSGNNGNPSQKIYATPASTSGDFHSISTSRPYISSTTPSTTTTTTTTTTEAPTTTTTLSPKNEAKIRENIANLPDEVPDDIREQLLSSGILGNADIQILDYDKVGDIPIEKLPPEALANFYGAGGASAVAASEPVPSIVKKPKTADSTSIATSSSSTSSTISTKKAAVASNVTMFEQATLRPGGVEMKVVRFDPNTEQGQALADQHIRDDATRLNPVTVGERDESQYNRYLPLKVSGASFPIPSVPELNGRKISSVVVLAPVDTNFHEEKEIESRQGRKVSDVQAVKFHVGETLKELVKKPTAENYKKWLELESRTEPQKQSVVLLVTIPNTEDQDDKEIFMYDIVSKTVSKLAGDLSTAFVDAAESNSDTDSFRDTNSRSS